MKRDQTFTFPRISNAKWWLLAVFIFLLCLSGVYVFSLYLINSTQNDLVANHRFVSLLHNEKSKPEKIESKNSLINLDSILLAQQLEIKSLYVLSLEDNKTRIFYALNDTSSIGKPFDLTTKIKDTFFLGSDFFELKNFYSLFPSVIYYAGNIMNKPPHKLIYSSEKDIPFLPYVILGGLGLAILLPLSIIVFARKNKKNIIYQKQQFIEQLNFALEKSDYIRAKSLLGENDGLIFYVKDLTEKIVELQGKETSYKESLEVQIKQMVELLKPLTEGKWDIPVDVPPGVLTPIAENINRLVDYAKGVPEKSAGSIDKDIEEQVIPAESEETAFSDSSDWVTTINGSGDEIIYLDGQLDLIAKILPPMFEQIEELYESQLNRSLSVGQSKDLKSLRMLETLISEKSSTIVTLNNLKKTVNELIMLQNWINHKSSTKIDKVS